MDGFGEQQQTQGQAVADSQTIQQLTARVVELETKRADDFDHKRALATALRAVLSSAIQHGMRIPDDARVQAEEAIAACGC